MNEKSTKLFDEFSAKYPALSAFIMTKVAMARIGMDMTVEDFVRACGTDEAVKVATDIVSGGQEELQRVMKEIAQIEAGNEEILSEEDKKISDDIVSKLNLE